MSVSVVKSQIAGTATRALAQIFWRAAISSTGTAAQYAAPRNAAVSGGAMVHAKYVSVCSGKTVSCKPARNTKVLAAYRSQRIGAITGRTPGAGSSTDITRAAMHSAAIRLLLSSSVLREFGRRPSSEVLAHPDFSDPRSNPLGPFVFLFARDRVPARLPPRERLPRCSGGIAARPERHRMFTESPRPLLHESHEVGANPPALELSRDFDVDQLHLGSAVFGRDKAGDFVIEDRDEELLAPHPIRLLPYRREPSRIGKEGFRAGGAEPDVLVLGDRGVRDSDEGRDVLPRRGSNQDSRQDVRHGTAMSCAVYLDNRASPALAVRGTWRYGNSFRAKSGNKNLDATTDSALTSRAPRPPWRRAPRTPRVRMRCLRAPNRPRLPPSGSPRCGWPVSGRRRLWSRSP